MDVPQIQNPNMLKPALVIIVILCIVGAPFVISQPSSDDDDDDFVINGEEDEEISLGLEASELDSPDVPDVIDDYLDSNVSSDVLTPIPGVSPQARTSLAASFPHAQPPASCAAAR
jgi:hypothetical protein